jgi:bifunctional DNA-binding transcriptional regulator/antitoxin component of YhaV-PrlF toxin-antitoxin module
MLGSSGWEVYMTHEEMERLTADTDVKSEKIRILFNAGAERADIGRFMGISYQYVQNVLKRSGLLGKSRAAESDFSDHRQVYTVTLGSGGKITLPAEYIHKHGIAEGEVLICREEGGGLTIMSRDAAVEAVREIARQHMPGESALLEALLTDRNRTG